MPLVHIENHSKRDHFDGSTGSTRAEGCCASWRIVLVAATKVHVNRSGANLCHASSLPMGGPGFRVIDESTLRQSDLFLHFFTPRRSRNSVNRVSSIRLVSFR